MHNINNTMKNILICGDSFAADWTKKYPKKYGWPNILSKSFNITNIAQAGCSEYKIWLQLQSQSSILNDYDVILISHTSPYRLYVKDHPIHKSDNLHHSSDLIYSDIKYYYEETKDNKVESIINFFENIVDLEYSEFVYELIYYRIIEFMSNYQNILHISGFDIPFQEVLSFHNYFKQHNGLMNHFDDYANTAIADELINKILKFN